MIDYISRRFVYMLISLFLLSFVSFVIIELPPGDFAEMSIRALEVSGAQVDQGLIDQLRSRYGYDKSFTERYATWFSDIVLRQDFGIAMQRNRPVSELILDRLPFTILLSVATLIFTYAVAIPIGIFSATRQYSIGDYLFSFFGFIGVAVPDFLLALVLMYILLVNFGISPGGLFSPEYENAPWSLAKIWDLAQHLIVPIVITGMAGTAVLIRTMRATLLDELSKDYVDTARMKGVPYWRAIWKYPVRIAINPLLSTIGWLLPAIVSGSTIVAIVLNLPTVGPLLIGALLAQDMFLAGGIIFILSFLTLVGTFLSDMILALADPRIRYD